jgi:beta-mannosidase
MIRRIALIWQAGHHPRAADESTRWVPAAVPGAVQLDWARAEDWPPYWVGNNFEQYGWMEDVYWTCRAALPDVPLGPDDRLYFVCGGVDYRFSVWVNGEERHTQEGMFTPFEIDLTDTAARSGSGGSELRVRIAPVPKSVKLPADRTQANRSCKPAVSYGWDFHPRLIPSGIWQEAYLEVRSRLHLTRAEASCRPAEDLRTAELRLDAELNAPADAGAWSVRWRVLDPAGSVVHDATAPFPPGQAAVAHTFTLENPELWWPHDQGTPALYTSQAELVDAGGAVVQEVQRRLGVRRIRLVMHPGAWGKPDTFPKGCSVPPITLEVNGRRIFAKGANWVSPDIFPGTLTEARYREMLTLVRDANLNTLRLWGGAIVQKEPFYDLCDELGILIWQEFPLACNLYPDDPAYLAVLDQESRSILRRLRQHPCVALWCGGNELFNGWSGMTDQSLPLRLLNRNCYDLAPETPFLMTSPVMGMGHGHYVFRDPNSGEEAWQLFQQADCTAYTEFGVAGPAPRTVLESFLPPDERFPPRPGTAWEAHHAFGVWMPSSHLYLGVIEHYFGPCANLDELIECGQLLQGEGYKGLFEEARRQKPTAAMALNWCLNEPWPTAANNSLISYPCVPKPALAAVREACRPTLASARVRKFSWQAGEWFDPELWLLHDGPEGISPGTLEAWLRAPDGGETRLLTWEFSELPPNTNQRGPRVQVRLPAFDGGGGARFQLLLRCRENPALDSAYTLILSGAAQHRAETTTPAENAAPTMNL